MKALNVFLQHFKSIQALLQSDKKITSLSRELACLAVIKQIAYYRLTN